MVSRTASLRLKIFLTFPTSTRSMPILNGTGSKLKLFSLLPIRKRNMPSGKLITRVRRIKVRFPKSWIQLEIPVAIFAYDHVIPVVNGCLNRQAVFLINAYNHPVRTIPCLLLARQDPFNLPDLSSHYFCPSPIHQAQLLFSPRPPCVPADPLNKTTDANLSERESAVLQDPPTARVEQESKKTRQPSRLMDYHLVFIGALHVNRLSSLRKTRQPTHIN